MYLTLPVGQDGDFVPLLLIEKKLAKGQLWKFEQISEDSGGFYQPRVPTSLYFKPQNKPGNSSAGIDVIVPEDSDNLYADDAHFHTDMLFNMPRTPFTRTQRAAALEWARKLGAKNVPSLESLDECERRFKAGQRRAPDENNLAYSVPGWLASWPKDLLDV
ncbi:hypothetical protein BDV93DRAFT_542430 [Ceratobasidium sp. AG-I]|nr:hypothetical protein BDV93DRAFT_542430 [Ceratobasidium sp. AG-I]